MRKNLLGLLIGSAFAFAGTAHAGLILDLNGAAAGGVINADALDWAPTSFLAKNGNSAIANFASTSGKCIGIGVDCSFTVMSQAVLTGYKPVGGGTFGGLPASGGGQITMVASYQEMVTGFLAGATPIAQFTSTGAGTLEFYYNPLGNATDLTGSGFNAGTLIGRLTGVTIGAGGNFSITDATPVALDQASPAPNQYTGQMTVSGFGSQQTIDAGTTGVDLDPTFFLTKIAGFGINFTNISIGLPYKSVKPADCFNTTELATAVGTSGLVSECDALHTNGLYSAQVNATGYTPVVGGTNGLNLGSPDFVAQTDFNSAVLGVPEPGSLALVGLALATAGFAASRRRRS